MMANKAIDEMGAPQKTGTRMKSIAKKKTPTKIRKQAGVAATANTNFEAISPVTILEDAAGYMKGEKLAKHSKPTMVRQVAVAATNLEVEVSENAGTENMEAIDAGENMQGRFDGEITPLDGGENMQGREKKRKEKNRSSRQRNCRMLMRDWRMRIQVQLRFSMTVIMNLRVRVSSSRRLLRK
ncbi:hypothetical protein ACH5RR_040487 [Cinchona calisaya]|uniref:Uncharacterized protein n=1 Tax=Cinchona calisaya TaxID=153742 RepID=A0ABD2XW44_9GENT